MSLNQELISACQRGLYYLVVNLLSQEFDLDWTDQHGNTALHYACNYPGKIGLVRLLIQAGFEVNVANYFGTSPLHLAANSNSLTTVQLLLEQGAKVNAIDKDKNTALHLAAQNGYVEIAKVLINYEADINLKNKFDHVPLFIAIDKGRTQMTTFLIDNSL